MVKLPIRTPVEVAAMRKLDAPLDDRVVAWAETMLRKGHESTSLAVLAGMSGPYNAFEMAELVDRALHDLGVEPIDDRGDAASELATIMVRRTLANPPLAVHTLSVLAGLYVDHDVVDLVKFWRLNYALLDIADGNITYYWPGADRSNIKTIVLDTCRTWLDERAGSGN